jgi:2-keto-4-pentenoate hydratase/2-oxohepta-3-ene-1,7-dioic acid hydratase in catechol pathway
VIGTGDIIAYPRMSKRVDYEGELAVVIKKKTCLLADDDPVEEYILGYTCFNDITARDLQTKDVQFTRAKSFDTFAACGPCIATDVDPSALHVKTFLNGKLRQSGNTRNLIFTVPFLVRFISRIMTLFPGDIISTGTPAGVGPMQPGDRVDVQIEGIGTLSNQVMRITE